jgi:spore coat protein U-like protein
LAALLCALALLLPWGARAGTYTLSASATVASNCTVATAALAFGSYDPIGTHRTGGANLNANGSVSVTCVKGVAPSIALGLGANVSGSTRRMKSGGSNNYLNYELYQPPSTTAGAACTFPGTVVWGTAGANLFSATAATSKSARSYNVCGTIAAGQDPAIGTYADTVVATVTF